MTNRKALYRGIKFEDIEFDTFYAISINPLVEYKPKQNLGTYLVEQYDVLKKLALEGIELILYPESSPTGRIHFHGSIRITSKHYIGHYLRFLHYLAVYGSYCIKPITDNMNEDYDPTQEYEDYKGGSDGWADYCTKQCKLWKDCIGNYISVPLHFNKPTDKAKP